MEIDEAGSSTKAYALTRDEKIDLHICKFSRKVDANSKFGHLCSFLYRCKVRDLLYICNRCKGANAAIALTLH